MREVTDKQLEEIYTKAFNRGWNAAIDNRLSEPEIKESGFMTAAELKAYNMGFNDALDRVEELLRREQSAERLHNTAGRKAGERT